MDVLSEIATQTGLNICSTQFSKHLDETDPLGSFRERFHIPSAQEIQNAEQPVPATPLPPVSGSLAFIMLEISSLTRQQVPRSTLLETL